eukprot:scaffold255667_cov18-Tisochrysis_lutea.AAC.1
MGEQPLPERLRQALKSWFLPAGFPASTSSDYLDYQLITFPTHGERLRGYLRVLKPKGCLCAILPRKGSCLGFYHLAVLFWNWTTPDQCFIYRKME